jgi:colanic acid biosynthesis protein WcaH
MNDDQTLLPLEQYKTLMEIAPIATVDVIFFNETKDKTLLFRRVNEPLKGTYFTIGGRLAKGETFVECALRQAKRELGLSLDPDRLWFGGVQEEIHPNSSFPGISYHSVDLFYGYILEADVTPQLDPQHDAYSWFSTTDETLHSLLKSKVKKTLTAL